MPLAAIRSRPSAGPTNGGREGLAFEDALPLAQKKLGAVATTRLTVRQAMTLYVEFLEAEGKRTSDVEGRAAVHILPQLGDKFVSELTPAILRRWLADLARSPVQLRSPRAGKLNIKALDPNDGEAVRARR